MLHRMPISPLLPLELGLKSKNTLFWRTDLLCTPGLYGLGLFLQHACPLLFCSLSVMPYRDAVGCCHSLIRKNK